MRECRAGTGVVRLASSYGCCPTRCRGGPTNKPKGCSAGGGSGEAWPGGRGKRKSKRALLAQDPGSSTARPKAPPATPRGRQARAGCHKAVVRQRGRRTRPLRWMAAQLKPARYGEVSHDAAQIFLLQKGGCIGAPTVPQPATRHTEDTAPCLAPAVVWCGQRGCV